MRSCCARERSMPSDIAISVVYALPDRQEIATLTVSSEMTVAQAVERSGLLRNHPGLSLETLNCAIFGRAVPLTQRLNAGDRIEILRPLLIDPKESRRQAAARTKSRR